VARDEFYELMICLDKHESSRAENKSLGYFVYLIDLEGPWQPESKTKNHE